MKSQLIPLQCLKGCVFFFSFDMQQGHMGEGEVTLLFLTFECIVLFGEDPVSTVGKGGGRMKYKFDPCIFDTL